METPTRLGFWISGFRLLKRIQIAFEPHLSTVRKSSVSKNSSGYPFFPQSGR
jgi:hypothetical protein